MPKQKFVFPMRDTMPFFVSSLRAVDDWKRIHAKRADAITQAEHEANVKFVKSPFARSMNVEDLLRFLDDTVLDINFMVQLPSIEQCLERWWKLYAHLKQAIDLDALRNVYYDLAFVLVEAKTETIHKNSVSMILRASWTKWSAKEPPLGKSEFFRLLFILAHLMTATDRLNDYIAFFHETMGRISRNYHQKQMRTEQHSRKPRMRRKSTLEELLQRSNSLSSTLVSDRNRVHSATMSHSNDSPNQVLNVQMVRVQMRTEGNVSEDEDEAGDCFVELLERNSRYQRVVVDPLLNDRRFQEKFRHPGGGVNSNTISTNEMLVALNPISNKYCPPLMAIRLKTKPSPIPSPTVHRPPNAAGSRELDFTLTASYDNLVSGSSTGTIRSSGEKHALAKGSVVLKDQVIHSAKSTPALVYRHGANRSDIPWNSSVSDDVSPREEALMQRSLSRVTLKSRVDRNKVAGEERLKNTGLEALDYSPGKNKPRRKKRKKERNLPDYFNVNYT